MRAEVAARKIAQAEVFVADASRLLSTPAEAFSADVSCRDLAAFYLMLAVQECVDLASHWIADAGWPVADDSAGCFDVLADRGAIPRELASAMRGCVGIRNRIAHGYVSVDHRRLHDEAPVGLAAIRAFLAAAAGNVDLPPSTG